MRTSIASNKVILSNGTSYKNEATKKALIYNGPDKIEYMVVPKPEIASPTDTVVKIIKPTICRTDLGILHRKTPSV